MAKKGKFTETRLEMLDERERWTTTSGLEMLKRIFPM
jgi:hypothetical protein